MQKTAKLKKETKEMRKRLPPKGGNIKVIAGILAAITAMTPVMTYAAEVVDQPLDEIATETTNITQSQEMYQSVTISPEITQRKLNIDITLGGHIVFNKGLDSEQTIKAENNNGQKEFKIYDKSGALIDSQIGVCTCNFLDSEILNVNAYSDNDYIIGSFQITNEETNFSEPVSDFFYTTAMCSDKTLTVSFLNSKNEKDLSVKEKQKESSSPNDVDLIIKDNKSNTASSESLSEDLSVNSVTKNVIVDEGDMSSDISDDLAASETTASSLKNTERPKIEAQEDNTNQCYILAYEINKIIDGTAPFDSNDDAGNDSNDENGIVRSFDTINYTLKYTTAIKDADIQGIDSTNVMVDFLLSCSPIKAEFNVDTMTWMLDKQITYTYDDGSTSLTYDRNKNVVSQRLTGRRLLVNSEAGNTVPGTGTLAIGINVNAAVSGDVIKPEFTIWMEGNTENEKKTLSASTTVSAAPKYDIVIKRNGSANLLGYYNLDDKTAKNNKEKETDKYGRLQTYAIGLAIQNDSVQKGMKGVEYPDGSDITFDLKMSEFLSNVDVSDQEAYKPLFWDYKMSNGYSSTGKLGRLMAPFGQSIASYGSWTTNTPENSGNYSGGCYNGGNMDIVADASDDNLLHVTLSGYQLDMKDFDFPVKYSGASYNSIPVNTGYFSIGIFQMIARFKTNVDVIENVGVRLQASNIHATSMSGMDVTYEVDNNNNISNVQVTNYPDGSHSKRNFYLSSTGNYLRSTTWDSGDSYAYIGEQVQVCGHMVYTGDRYLEATNILQKIDDDAFTVPAGTSKYTMYSRSNELTEIGDIKTLFAAKPDKTGWTNDDEMNNTHEEQLIYFKNIDDLTSAGYTCVGMLYEIRNSKLYPNNSGGCVEMRQILNIRPDVKTGNVYMTKNDVRSWRDGTAFSYADIAYDNSIKAYGIGDVNWTNETYADGYEKPTYRTDLNYGKAVYKDGTMVSGHRNGYQGGNSLLIIGNRTSIGIEVADMTGEKPKSVYDLDAGERTATFTVKPATIITSANSEVQTSDAKDNLKITVTLPNGLHFNENGVSLKPESVTVNSDGTTTIIWTMNDVKVGTGLDPITFSTTIGEEGTANDVHHNDAFTVVAKITSDNDTRKVMAANGNYSETGISLIKLAASAVTKRVLTPLVERGQNIEFRLRYSNLSDTEAINAKIYDILPFNEDERGSSFSGSYDLTNIRIDFSNAKKTYQNGKDKIESYLSNIERNKSNMEHLMTSGNGLATFFSCGENITDDSKYEISWNNITFKDAASLYLYLGYVFGHEYVDVYITMAPKDTDTKQQPGDIYGNNFVQYADNQASTVTSNVVKAQVVKRELSGVAWIDDNADGIRSDSEALLSNVKVQLYRTTDSKFNPNAAVINIGNGNTVSSAYDVFGQKIKETATDETGYYHFDNLEDGIYFVVFTGAEGYYVTTADVGDDDTIDSDALFEMNDILIPNVTLPAIANMTDWSFSSPNHDVGFVRKTTVEIAKIGTVTKKLLEGAELEIYNLSDIKNGKPKENAKPIAAWTTEKNKTKKFENILLVGKQYVLIETKAPADYAIADPITFTVNSDGSYQKITMSDDYDTHPVAILKKNTDGDLISGAVLKITGKEDGKATEIEPIQWTSEAGKEHSVELRKGSYTLQEVAPPVGYLAAKNINFTVDKDGDILISGKKVDKVEMTDVEVKAGKINIRKFDTDGKTPLAGVKFELKFVSAKYPDISSNKNYTRLLKPGETKELTTDTNGNISFENLDQGEYVLTETGTVSGHQLLKDSINITLPLVMTEEEIKKTKNIDIKKAEKIGDSYYFYELSYEISNDVALKMPRTGSNGIWKYGFFGICILSGVAIFVIYKKRKI